LLDCGRASTDTVMRKGYDASKNLLIANKGRNTVVHKICPVSSGCAQNFPAQQRAAKE